MKYTVIVADNFHYMDESENYTLGEFDSAEEALARAKEIVDDCLTDIYSQVAQKQKPGTEPTAVELYSQYTTFGEDPYIVSEDKTAKFSAWSYAKQRCEELVKTSPSP